MPTRCDAIVIGTGQAGPSLTGRLAGAGMRVAIVERHLFGGKNATVYEGHARLEGPRQGDEAIHSILDVMYARKPYTVILRAVHIHPTVSELIPTLLGDLAPLD